jgi:hypothetical protein
MAKKKATGEYGKGHRRGDSGQRGPDNPPGDQACGDKPAYGYQSDGEAGPKFVFTKDAKRNNFTPLDQRRFLQPWDSVLSWSEPISALHHFSRGSGILAIDLVE